MGMHGQDDTMTQMHRQMMQGQGGMGQGMHGGMGGHDGMHNQQSGAVSAAPTMPGQDAFGAIQEIVQILQSDPKTDWSTEDLKKTYDNSFVSKVKV